MGQGVLKAWARGLQLIFPQVTAFKTTTLYQSGQTDVRCLVTLNPGI